MRWKATSRSKARGERFILCYSPVWIGCLALIVLLKWYKRFSPNDFILTGLCVSLPCILGPLLLARTDNERHTPLTSRYIIKANAFIGIIGYLGNHFYTHYFYNLLGVKYTGPLAKGKGLEINSVPVSMFLMTHPYFMTYHVLVTPLIRATKSMFQSRRLQLLGMATVVVVAFATAFAETWTISSFPYYTYPDLYQMLTKGSVFYGTFFIVTFPWFFRLDEDLASPWPISRVIIEALAAMMVVLFCADIWRLCIEKFGSAPSTHIPYAQIYH